MTRIAVIGHVEWVEHARLHEPLESGVIVQLHDAFEEPAGGGGVAARALPALGARDDASSPRWATTTRAPPRSARCARTAASVRVARRPNPQNRVTTVVDPGGERTILIHGTNDHPDAGRPAWLGRSGGLRRRLLHGRRSAHRGRRAPRARARRHRPQAGERRGERRAGRRAGRLGARSAESATTWPTCPCSRACASGARAPRAGATSPMTAPPAAGRPRRRRPRSSTRTARATCSWRR